ncbi:MAG: hypothetical protein HUU15_06555 [Candidatus Brocadiae bacterium]|nr:hypothetical protein [Candidatus Brocadiia bacterium]
MHPVAVVALGLTIGLAVLLAFLALIYLVAPLIVRSTAWQAAEPSFLPREPQPGSGEVDAWFDAIGPTLADAGYGEAQRWTVRGLHLRSSIDLLIMTHRQKSVVANVIAIHSLAGSLWRLQARVVEFSSRKQNGRVLNTTNTPSLLPRTEWPHKQVHVFDQIQAPLFLEAVHLALRARETDATWEPPPAVVAMPAAYILGMRQDMETLVADGWMRFDPKRNRYTLTLRGAFPLTWRGLWPVSLFVRRRQRRKAEALLAELGLTEAPPVT